MYKPVEVADGYLWASEPTPIASNPQISRPPAYRGWPDLRHRFDTFSLSREHINSTAMNLASYVCRRRTSYDRSAQR